MFAIRSFHSLSLILVDSCFPMATVCSGYLLLIIILSSASPQLRTFFAIYELVALDFFFLLSLSGGSYVDSTMPIPLGVWNFMAPWIVDTMIPIRCMMVLSNNRLCGELDRMIKKLRTSIFLREPSPIMISKGTSPRGKECYPEKPTSGTRESTLSD
ncbi:hypothetical protein Tco_1162170 [Tanacetum coccineum]